MFHTIHCTLKKIIVFVHHVTCQKKITVFFTSYYMSKDYCAQLQTNVPPKWGMYDSNLYSGGPFDSHYWPSSCAVLTSNIATRLTWQSCAWGIATRLTYDATSQCSLIQPAMQSDRALTYDKHSSKIDDNASANIVTPHPPPHTHTHTHAHYTINHKPLVAVHARPAGWPDRRPQLKVAGCCQWETRRRSGVQS